MDWIDDLQGLAAHYGTPGPAALIKVAPHLTPAYRAWIAASRFCLLSTAGPEGTDCSPRGDDGPVVRALDARTLALPDWRGNDRIDSLRNIVADGRVSLTFLVAGSDNLVRVNGRARLTADPDLRGAFARDGALPRTVIVVAIDEVYFQCARALKRARLWTDGDRSAGLPSAGDILREMSEGAFDGAAYDADWARRAAAGTMW